MEKKKNEIDHYYREMISASQSLNSSEIKKLIRDIQNELSSAWKFHMKLGIESNVLVILDRLTGISLSLARNCSHVYVYGLNNSEIFFLNNLAKSKQITNYSCIDDLTHLEKKIDLVLFYVAEIGEVEKKFSSKLLQNIRHSDTEFWVIAKNTFTFHCIKEFLYKFKMRFHRNETNKTSSQWKDLRLPHANRPKLFVRQAIRYLKRLSFNNFSIVMLVPSIYTLKTVKLAKSFLNLDKSKHPMCQSFRSHEIVIGACQKNQNRSFLDRLFNASHSGLTKGILMDYIVSASGKVLISAHFSHNNQEQRTFVKLPLNELTRKRLILNHKFLKFLAMSDKIDNALKINFPQPLHEGNFENQPYFIESAIFGKSGDQILTSHGAYKRMAHKTFSFWIPFQNSVSRNIYFDDRVFFNMIEKPLSQVFELADGNNGTEKKLDRLKVYLRAHFFNKKYALSIIHGDFSLKNIVYNEQSKNLMGIIDWDMAREVSFPIIDAFHFFVRIHADSYRRPLIQILLELLNKNEISEDFQRVLNMYYEVFDIEPDSAQAFAIMYWVHILLGHMGSLAFLDESFICRNFLTPLDLFLDKIILSETV